MKKVYLIFILLIGISISCTKNFEDFNTDEKHPTEVPGEFLFANAQKALVDDISNTDVNENIFKLVAQYWTETTYTDEVNYDIPGRTISDNIFLAIYRDVLADLADAKKSIAAEPAAGEEQISNQANRLAIVDLTMSYTYMRLLEIFGDIPYTEALDINNISPVYDDANTIYQSLLETINAAIVTINQSLTMDGEGYGSFGSSDKYFGGDITMWRKFAHTLKLRIAITLVDVDNNAQGIIETSYDKAFGPNEKCELQYETGTNSNPLYQDLVQSGRHDFVPANTIVDHMNDLDDPRRAAYFTLYDNGTPDDPSDDHYIGGTYGESNNFATFSHIADPIQEPDYPFSILDGIEVSFYLAEAAARGFNVGHDAAYYYNQGITASFDKWGVDGVTDYLAKPEVAYTETGWTENAKQLIAEQAWIAYYLRGLLAWNTWRRLDYPVLNMPPSPVEPGVIPKRFTYPVNEQTLNAANYYAAGTAIGGDFQATKLFWDVN